MRVSSNKTVGYRVAAISDTCRDLLEYSDSFVGEKLWVDRWCGDFWCSKMGKSKDDVTFVFEKTSSFWLFCFWIAIPLWETFEKLKKLWVTKLLIHPKSFFVFRLLLISIIFPSTDIFHNLKQFGNFAAIILTYLISASLHGLNFQLAAVLLSIGVFTFVEYRLRNVLAEILDACVSANKCSPDSTGSCASKGHKNTPTLAWVKMINFAFGVFTVVLLAYLGVLLDTSIDQSKGFSWERNLKKWIELKFFGHIIVFIWFVMYLILRNWRDFLILSELIMTAKWRKLFRCQHFRLTTMRAGMHNEIKKKQIQWISTN